MEDQSNIREIKNYRQVVDSWEALHFDRETLKEIFVNCNASHVFFSSLDTHDFSKLFLINVNQDHINYFEEMVTNNVYDSFLHGISFSFSSVEYQCKIYARIEYEKETDLPFIFNVFSHCFYTK